MPICKCGVETPEKSIMYWTDDEWRCPVCKKINEATESPTPSGQTGLALLSGELLTRALSLLNDEQVAQVFEGIDIEAHSVPIDTDQLDRIAKLVEGVAI